MNRREMLKLGAAMAVAPSLPVPVLTTWKSGWMRVPNIGPEIYAVLAIERTVRTWSADLVFPDGTEALTVIARQRLNEATGMWEDV
jgi:hypothetical protein